MNLEIEENNEKMLLELILTKDVRLAEAGELTKEYTWKTLLGTH